MEQVITANEGNHKVTRISKSRLFSFDYIKTDNAFSIKNFNGDEVRQIQNIIIGAYYIVIFLFYNYMPIGR